MAAKNTESHTNRMQCSTPRRPRSLPQVVGDLSITIDSSSTQKASYTDFRQSILLLLEIPNQLLYNWQANRGGRLFTELVNAKIESRTTKLVVGHHSTEERLAVPARKLWATLKKTKGRKRERVLSALSYVFVKKRRG